MKTRTLLLLAVTVGLLILVAGSIKVFLIAEDKPVQHLVVPSTSTIGDMTVTVQRVQVQAGETLITVRLIGVDDDDGASSWVFGTGADPLQPHAPPAGAGAACAATSASTATTCVLAFDTDDARGVLGYNRSDKTLRWDVVGPVGDAVADPVGG